MCRSDGMKNEKMEKKNNLRDHKSRGSIATKTIWKIV